MQSVITASLYHGIVIETGSAADVKEEFKMRKWKKAVSLMLTAAMALSFAACGGSASSASSASSTAGSSEAESGADSAAASENVASFTESDVAYVQDKGTLVVGMTDFAPMDYRNDSGEWIGFDADMAKAFAEYLGVEAEFLEINWDNKLMELDTKGVDAIWNGMTITDEVTNGRFGVRALLQQRPGGGRIRRQGRGLPGCGEPVRPELCGPRMARPARNSWTPWASPM